MHFGENPVHWAAVGWLHDYDYEKYPEEHLQHTEAPLRALGVPEEDIRAILARRFPLDKSASLFYTETDLQGGAQFPTGGKVREPSGRSGETPEPTVQSGWKKIKRFNTVCLTSPGSPGFFFSLKAEYIW